MGFLISFVFKVQSFLSFKIQLRDKTYLALSGRANSVLMLTNVYEVLINERVAIELRKETRARTLVDAYT